MSSTTELFDLPFVAPIPAGHEVLVGLMLRTGDDPAEAVLVLDVTAATLYCDDKLWGPLGRDAVATIDPIGVLSKWFWSARRAVRGRVVGAIVATKHGGEAAGTRLFVAPTNAEGPYR